MKSSRNSTRRRERIEGGNLLFISKSIFFYSAFDLKFSDAEKKLTKKKNVYESIKMKNDENVMKAIMNVRELR